ncbi:MAG: sporulation protein YunB [bacterium]|nr:sporulation protein YunB [bacterium]
MKLKKRKSYFNRLKRLIFIILIISLTFFIIIRKPISYISDFFLNYAEIESTKVISSIINSSSSSEDFDKISFDNLYRITRNNENEIEMIDYNLSVVNELLDEITLKIQTELKDIEEKEILKIPFGIIFNNPFLNHLGPNIPIKIKLISSVLTNVNTKLSDYGINNSLIEISINIEVRAKIILPINSKDIVVSNDLPISYKIITGKIPEYYSGTISKNSGIYKIPLE